MIDIAGIPVYEAQPAGTCKGGVIVIHEVWGLTDHIKDVAGRVAGEGYYVIAPNLLSETDIEKHLTPEMARDLFNPEKRNTVQPILRQHMAPLQSPEFAEATVKKLRQCFDYLFAQKVVAEKVAVMGFCFGGSYSFSLAVTEPRLKAAVPFYGHANQSADELKTIGFPIVAFYGEKDENLMAGLPELKQRMAEVGVDFTPVVYPNCGHAFFNDTNPFAYSAEAARSAWRQTLEFLSAHMT